MRRLIRDGSDDDRWYLCHGDDPADMYVFNKPNGPSCGMQSRIELAALLASGKGSPKHRALHGMIGSLVGAGQADPASKGPVLEPGAAGAEPTPGEAATSI